MTAKKKLLNTKETTALLIALVSAIGILVMWNAEGLVVLEASMDNPSEILKQFNAMILPGIQKYSLAMGAILFAISITFVLIDGEDDISTTNDSK
ncbi:MAG: hypothetical protein AAGI66_05805 [Cyanobacteria bacterium P01_H01_bin.74]